jgi:hypothetical protein
MMLLLCHGRRPGVAGACTRVHKQAHGNACAHGMGRQWSVMVLLLLLLCHRRRLGVAGACGHCVCKQARRMACFVSGTTSTPTELCHRRRLGVAGACASVHTGRQAVVFHTHSQTHTHFSGAQWQYAWYHGTVGGSFGRTPAYRGEARRALREKCEHLRFSHLRGSSPPKSLRSCPAGPFPRTKIALTPKKLYASLTHTHARAHTPLQGASSGGAQAQV